MENSGFGFVMNIQNQPQSLTAANIQTSKRGYDKSWGDNRAKHEDSEPVDDGVAGVMTMSTQDHQIKTTFQSGGAGPLHGPAKPTFKFFQCGNMIKVNEFLCCSKYSI